MQNAIYHISSQWTTTRRTAGMMKWLLSNLLIVVANM
jgi:hypothetical protein